jgi:endonuclease/exonuclease/phosphatase family metal-dependent hydrolase
VPSVGDLRVATLNIWGRSGNWPARREVLRQRVTELDVDVLGLQEVEELVDPDGAALNQAEELARALGFHLAYGISFSRPHPGGGTRHFGNAVLSRFPISSSKCCPLPDAERDEPRSVLFAVVDAPFAPVPFAATHLAWRLDNSAGRVKQVVELARVCEELWPERSEHDPDDPTYFPVVVLADLNAEPGSDELRYLTGLTSLGARGVRYADVWRYGGAGPGYTYDPLNSYAAEAHEHARRIDYVLVRGPGDGGTGLPREPRLAFTEHLDGVYASDHFGVVVDLAAPPFIGRSGQTGGAP